MQGRRVYLVQSKQYTDDPDEPANRLGSLAAALAESLGVSWEWRDYGQPGWRLSDSAIGCTVCPPTTVRTTRMSLILLGIDLVRVVGQHHEVGQLALR